MKDRLVLFDIDGTLLRCGKVWIECYLESVREEFPNWEMPQVSFGGKTDHWIARELITAQFGGREPGDLEPIATRIVSRYLQKVRSHREGRVMSEVRVLPGAEKLLEALAAEKRVALSVLTGNMREGASLKLEVAGLLPALDLELGAFGSDHWQRSRLPEIAVSRALERLGREFRGREIVIIGDTVHDITCGRHLGVKTIGVGTGHDECRAPMLAEKPDHFFEDLTDSDAVLAAILG